MNKHIKILKLKFYKRPSNINIPTIFSPSSLFFCSDLRMNWNTDTLNLHRTVQDATRFVRKIKLWRPKYLLDSKVYLHSFTGPLLPILVYFTIQHSEKISSVEVPLIFSRNFHSFYCREPGFTIGIRTSSKVHQKSIQSLPNIPKLQWIDSHIPKVPLRTTSQARRRRLLAILQVKCHLTRVSSLPPSISCPSLPPHASRRFDSI